MKLPPSSVDIYKSLVACQRDGKPAVLAIIVAAFGSTPQETGAKMLVQADGSTVGTVGGGQVEAQVVHMALKVLDSGTPRLLDLELTEEAGSLSGGHVRIYLEPVAVLPLLIIVGAEHVGLALAALASFAGFQVALADDRDAVLPEALAGVKRVIITDYRLSFNGLEVSEKTAIVIATRGHNHDQETVAAALETPARYIGLLGSAKKREAMVKALEEMGFSREDLARVRVPVGLDLGVVSPEEIAVSIVAQLIAQRRNHEFSDFGPAAGRRLVESNGSA